MSRDFRQGDDLGARRGRLGSSDLSYASISVSPSMIQKGNGQAGVYTVPVRGEDWLIRSDFPIVIEADGRSIPLLSQYDYKGGTEPFRPSGPWIRLRRPVERFTFRLPAGVGGGGQFESWKLHGICVVEGVPEAQAEPLLTDPDLLPPYCWRFNSGVIAIGAGPSLNLFFNVNSWALTIPNAVPKEVFVKSISVARLVNGTLIPSASSIQSVTLHKRDVPAGDTHRVFFVAGAGNGWSVPMNNLKIPLQAFYEPYAAETPELQFEVNHTIDAVDATVVTIAITGSYRI